MHEERKIQVWLLRSKNNRRSIELRTKIRIGDLEKKLKRHVRLHAEDHEIAEIAALYKKRYSLYDSEQDALYKKIKSLLKKHRGY